MAQPEITIPSVDDPGIYEHSTEHPFCLDASCMCHDNEEELHLVAQAVQNGEMTQDEADAFVAGKLL